MKPFRRKKVEIRAPEPDPPVRTRGRPMPYREESVEGTAPSVTINVGSVIAQDEEAVGDAVLDLVRDSIEEGFDQKRRRAEEEMQRITARRMMSDPSFREGWEKNLGLNQEEQAFFDEGWNQGAEEARRLERAEDDDVPLTDPPSFTAIPSPNVDPDSPLTRQIMDAAAGDIIPLPEGVRLQRIETKIESGTDDEISITFT